MSLCWTQRFLKSASFLRSQTRRISTTKLSTTLDEWAASLTSAPPRILSDHIAVSKVHDLYSTLPTRLSNNANTPTTPTLAKRPTPASGASLAPGHSLIFFHPPTPEAILAADQTSDAELGPPAQTGFTRRMWASGGFVWHHSKSRPIALTMGANATALARVKRVEQKGFGKALVEDKRMVFVHQEIAYRHEGEDEDLLTERRVHVYLPSGFGDTKSRVIKEVKGLPSNPKYKYSWLPTPTTLFRFSALTFNAHLIHLDRDYAQKIEGYPERLVHGPLTALMLLEAFHASTGYTGEIATFDYRAQNPVVVARRQHILGSFDDTGDRYIVWAEDDDGVVGMTGEIGLSNGR